MPEKVYKEIPIEKLCCDQAKKYVDSWHDCDGGWVVLMAESGETYMEAENVPVTFCPFCGKELPKE